MVLTLALTYLVSAGGTESRHWSLEPVVRPDVPPGTHPVDHFVDERLEREGLTRSEKADRYTLLRRATLDLTGLPPTRAEISDFLSDESDEAWVSVIDRLLASPHYGERWGRHWLDVARYVQGSIKVDGIDQIDMAAPYRDYVVRALNADKPFDEFLVEQLAGDLLAKHDYDEAAHLDRIAAPAFLSIGQWFDECTDPNKLRLDIVDEQISTATRAFLALDFSCARCHDHKFDPIPTRDYYALAGIFRSTEIVDGFAEDWKDGRPRGVLDLAMPEEVDRKREALEHIKMLRQEWLDLLVSARDRVASILPIEGQEFSGELARIEAEDFAGHKNLVEATRGELRVLETRRMLDQWAKYRIEVPAAGDYALVVRYAAESAAPVRIEINGTSLEERALGVATQGDSEEHFTFGTVELPGLKQGTNWIRFLVDRHEPFPILDRLHLFEKESTPTDAEIELAFWPPSAAALQRERLAPDERDELRKIEAALAEALASVPDLVPSLAVRDAEPRNLPVHVGGDVYRTEGESIPRGVPSLVDEVVEVDFPVPDGESGRLEFARWLAHPDHPLVSRVIVNRLWHWHFGTGLVATTDDFGKKGSPPTHPELLDWLAADLVENGWSLKHLHRTIMTSSTYRASSRPTGKAEEKGADGTLLSHFPPRRLEVEAIYDSMLAASGKVPRQDPGTPLDSEKSKDRALYILTSGRSPMGLGIEIRKMFPLFGFDDSGRPIHDRDESITPQQALWWLNNPLPAHYASKLAQRVLEESENTTERAESAHLIALGRPPSPEAARVFLAYIDESMDSGLSESEAWTRACLGLFSTRAFQTLE